MKTWFAVASACMLAWNVQAQDSLKINLADAESQFLKNNLLLLAGQYNVDAQKALIIQAKLWDNPRFSTELNAYNPDAKKAFDVGANGQKTFALEQVLYIGGKKKHEVAIAKLNAQTTEYDLQDLLRQLKFQLRKSFYSVYYDNLTLTQYTSQLQLLSDIIGAYDEQAAKGNISMKEVLRLKAAYYKLNNDKTELINNILNEQATLQTLLGTKDRIVPILNPTEIEKYKLLFNEGDLVNEALQNRPDYKVADNLLRTAESNLKYQRALGVPDLTVGGAYDQQGGAFRNQIGLTLAMDLPFWNFNQGNIRYAKNMVKVMDATKQNNTVSLTNEVRNVIEKVKRIELEYQTIDKNYARDYSDLNKGVIENFQKRNITLLEFVDFFESYNESLNEMNRLKKTRIETYEELNATVGKEIFNGN